MSPAHVTNDRVKSDSGFFFSNQKKMLNPFSFWVDEDDITRRSQTPTYMLPDGQQQLGSGVRVVVV